MAAVSPDTLAALQAYLANPDGPGFATNLQNFEGNQFGSFSGDPTFGGLYGDQFTKQLLNTPADGSTNPTITLGDPTRGTPISSGNPFYSYFQNLVSQYSPQQQQQFGSPQNNLQINAAPLSATSASLAQNGQLDIPQDILNQAQAWEQANSPTFAAGFNVDNSVPGSGTTQAQYKQNLLDASSGQQNNIVSQVQNDANSSLPLIAQLIKTGIISAAAYAGGPIGAAAAGAFEGGVDSGNLGGALKGGLESGISSYAGGAASSAAGAGAGSAADYGIQTGVGAGLGAGSAYVNGTSPSAGALTGAAGGALGAYSSSPSDSASAANAPTDGVMGSSSDTGSYAGNATPEGSVHLNGGGNLSGAGSISGAESPSFFDNLSSGNISGAASNVGNFVSNNPLTTIGAAALAIGGLNSAINSNSSSAPNISDIALNSPYVPSRDNPLSAPSSLSDLSSLTPEQQESNIATKGVYGGGEGPQENQYFLNLINRQLVDDKGNVGNMSSLAPIDTSYLSQLGLGGYGNTSDLLKGISQYGT